VHAHDMSYYIAFDYLDNVTHVECYTDDYVDNPEKITDSTTALSTITRHN
jgi:hypothetical protein